MKALKPAFTPARALGAVVLVSARDFVASFIFTLSTAAINSSAPFFCTRNL